MHHSIMCPATFTSSFSAPPLFLLHPHFLCVSSSSPLLLSEAMPVGGSGGLRGSVRGSGGSFSMHSLLQSYSSALRRPRSLGRSLSSYLNHTTRLGTFTLTHAHANTGRQCDVCVRLHSRDGNRKEFEQLLDLLIKQFVMH